jgi:hypothetical protein
MQAERIETPHKMKGFDAIAHDNMIRRMAYRVIESNKSSIKTITSRVSEIKQKIKTHKIEQNQFKKTRRKLDGLAALARHCSTVAGCSS